MKLAWRGPPVVDPDLLRSQAARPALTVIDPPGDAHIEHMAGLLSVADGDDSLSARAPGEAELPGRLSPAVALDEEIMLSGEVFQRRGHRPERVDDLGGDGCQPSRGRHRAIVELSQWIRRQLMSCRRSSRRRGRSRQWVPPRIPAGPASAPLATCSGPPIASPQSIL